MKKLLIAAAAFMLFSVSDKAQVVTSGNLRNLVDKRNVNVVFDYSETKLIRSDKTVEELVATDPQFAKEKVRDEKYCLGSLNDEIKEMLYFGSYDNPDAVLTFQVSHIRNDFENPRFIVRITDAEGIEIAVIENIETEDFNDAGHSLGKFLYKQLKRLK